MFLQISLARFLSAAFTDCCMVSIVVAHLLNYKIVMAEKQKGGCCSFIHKHLTPAPKPYSSICIVLSYVLTYL